MPTYFRRIYNLTSLPFKTICALKVLSQARLEMTRAASKLDVTRQIAFLKILRAQLQKKSGANFPRAIN